MALDKDTQAKIETLQLYEQNYQSLLMQKQTFQLESNEIENALKEIGETTDIVYKVVGRIMVPTEKQSLVSELKKKSELIKLRLKSIEKQEHELTKTIESLRNEVFKLIGSNNN